MKKNRLMNLFFSAILFFSLQVLFQEIWFALFHKEKPSIFISKNGEHFDPSLMHLSTVSKFENWCDSVYGSKTINPADSEQYAYIVAKILRDRFYHGYSYYRIGQNSLAFIFAPLIKADLNAIVIPDDIMKYPNAACSQQSIIGMEVFKNKGYKVRRVGFYADKYGGHFCYEAYFKGKWHFFDPDLEPKLSIMAANHFPSIAELNQNDTLLRQLYYNRQKDFVEKLFRSYSYGPVDKFPAPNARIYQYGTKYLSYFLWIFLLIVYFIFQRRLNRKQACVELQDSLVPELRS